MGLPTINIRNLTRKLPGCRVVLQSTSVWSSVWWCPWSVLNGKHSVSAWNMYFRLSWLPEYAFMPSRLPFKDNEGSALQTWSASGWKTIVDSIAVTQLETVDWVLIRLLPAHWFWNQWRTYGALWIYDLKCIIYWALAKWFPDLRYPITQWPRPIGQQTLLHSRAQCNRGESKQPIEEGS